MINYNKDVMAKASATSLPISTKHAIEICNFIRYKNLQKAKDTLKNAIAKKQAIPFRRFKGGVGHKTKIGPGRYPQKASAEILKILELAEANAQFKGLNTNNLKIVHLCVNKASRPWHFGRQRRRKTKRTHVEVIVGEEASNKREEKRGTRVREVKEKSKTETKIETKPKEEKQSVKK